MNLQSYNSKKLWVVEWINPKWGEFNYIVFDSKEDANLFFNDLSNYMENKTLNKLSINKIKKADEKTETK